MSRIDLPVLWLALFCAAAFAIGWAGPGGMGFGDVARGLGAAIGLGGGLIVIGLALTGMRRHRTTPDPHGRASALVTTGIFGRSRNPIYLGFVLILAGMVFRADAPLALPLIPVFLWWIERRFVLPEEDRLRRQFRLEFARYAEKTRRWL